MWASAFQSLVMLAAAISTAVVAVGSVRTGDEDGDSSFGARLSEVVRVLSSTGRARWFDPDPTPFGAPGSSTPSALAGIALAWSALMGCGQGAAQRFCATKSPARARG